jgi:DNA-binding response OmpR family regulator
MRKLKGQVLIADADRDTRDMVQCFLGHAGYGVTGAATVGESLDLVRQRHFDLILLDWCFEDGTGYDLCRKIQALDAGLPVLFCSGNSLPGEMRKAIQSGAQGYLVKPVDLEKLAESVDRCLRPLAP